jgi:hypothetical protein
MIESVCTGFVFGKRPDGTRTVSGPDCRHDHIDAVRRRHRPAIGRGPGTGLANRATSRERSGA